MPPEERGGAYDGHTGKIKRDPGSMRRDHPERAAHAQQDRRGDHGLQIGPRPPDPAAGAGDETGAVAGAVAEGKTAPKGSERCLYMHPGQQ